MPVQANGSGGFPDPPNQKKSVGKFVGGVATGFAVTGLTLVGALVFVAALGVVVGLTADVFSEGYELGGKLING